MVKIGQQKLKILQNDWDTGCVYCLTYRQPNVTR